MVMRFVVFEEQSQQLEGRDTIDIDSASYISPFFDKPQGV